MGPPNPAYPPGYNPACPPVPGVFPQPPHPTYPAGQFPAGVAPGMVPPPAAPGMMPYGAPGLHPYSTGASGYPVPPAGVYPGPYPHSPKGGHKGVYPHSPKGHHKGHKGHCGGGLNPMTGALAGGMAGMGMAGMAGMGMGMVGHKMNKKMKKKMKKAHKGHKHGHYKHGKVRMRLGSGCSQNFQVTHIEIQMFIVTMNLQKVWCMDSGKNKQNISRQNANLKNPLAHHTSCYDFGDIMF